MTPYYQDEHVTLYLGDCREVLPTLPDVDVLLTDPPYGINLDPDYTRRTFGGGTRAPSGFKRITGDAEPFNPSHLIGTAPLVILWGANNFAERLPVGRWLVWDKREQTPSNQLADVELAWCSKRGAARMFRHYWNGPVRASERGYHVHPTQKPVALMAWVLDTLKVPVGALVLDPYCGSGPVLRAAKDTGRRAIGVEIDEAYCEVTARRLAQGVLDFGVVS